MADIDPYDVLNALGVTGCSEASRVHGGWDTMIWRVTCGPDTYALRLFRAGNHHWAHREVEAMRAARESSVQVPEVHILGTWQDRSVMLLDWCDGRTVMQEMRARPWKIRSLGYEFGQRQAQLHQTEFSTEDSDALNWITSFGPVDDDLGSRLVAAGRQISKLLHLDYHPLNVMYARRSIGCILDWSNAMPGDPRADVARTWSILRLMPLFPGRPEPVTEAARKLLASGWLRGYQDTAGPLIDMEIFKVWAAVAMVHDLQRKVEQPENWIAQRHVDAIQARISQLRVRAGLV